MNQYYQLKYKMRPLDHWKNEIDVIKNDLEKLNRADVITSRARSELNMVIASPETLIVSMNRILASDLWQNPTRSIDLE